MHKKRKFKFNENLHTELQKTKVSKSHAGVFVLKNKINFTYIFLAKLKVSKWTNFAKVYIFIPISFVYICYVIKLSIGSVNFRMV